jgi:hypothetical protein
MPSLISVSDPVAKPVTASIADMKASAVTGMATDRSMACSLFVGCRISASRVSGQDIVDPILLIHQFPLHVPDGHRLSSVVRNSVFSRSANCSSQFRQSDISQFYFDPPGTRILSGNSIAAD